MKRMTLIPPGSRRNQRKVQTAFINIPYSPEYEERLMALIATLSLFGLVPTSASVASAAPNRLDRIISAIAECAVSIHDLTWVELDSIEPRTPRFNMPFEFGVALGLARLVGNEVIAMDSVPYRLDKALSDVRGLDVQIIDDEAASVFRALSNVFYRKDFQPEPHHFQYVLDRVRRAADHARVEYGFDSLFEAKPFSDLRRAASEAACGVLGNPRVAKRKVALRDLTR